MRALILLALLGATVAVPKNQQRIVGGTPATVETHPYMSNMQYVWANILWSNICGGTLINNFLVLSAAHCYEGDTSSQWRVRLGSSLASSGGTVYEVAQLILHTQYSSATIDNDIALVRLASPATFSDSVASARIASADYNIPDGTQLTIIGWGRLVSGGSSPEELQHVDTNVINQELCAERYARLKSQPGFESVPDVTPNMLCSGILDVGGKEACQGDSGGPVIHDGNVLVGIVSWSYDCAHAEYPGVNTRVSRYTDWIIDNA